MINDIKKQIATLMTAAFAFVAGLVWKDAIMEWFRPFIEGNDGAMALTVVAVVVTIVVVILTMVVAKVFGEK